MPQPHFEFDLSHTDPVPVYHQLEKAIQKYIESGQLAVGDLLPPERDICRLNSLSLSTVRKALQNLVQNGYLYRIQGKGTFVANTDIRRKNIRYYSFVKRFRGETGQPEIKFVDLKVTRAGDHIYHHLDIKPGQDLYEFQRLIIIDQKPVVYCISYLPCVLFPELDKYQPYNFEKHPLYIFIERKFGISTMKNRDLYGAVCADSFLADKLGVAEGHPLLMLEMQALTHKDRPYEYRISYCRVEERKILREY